MGFIERIAPGAFKSAIRNSDVRVLFNHDPNIVIGRSKVNLRLSEDENGLLMEVDPIDDEDFRRVAKKIENGLVTQQSFGFSIAKDGDEWSEDYRQRTITKVHRLYDVSPVTYPAYPDTTVAFRTIDKARKTSETVVLKDNEVEFIFKDEEQAQRIFNQLKKRFSTDEITVSTPPKRCDEPIIDDTKNCLDEADKLLRRN